jgi:hydrogenase nickel incorporation protein HypB
MRETVAVGRDVLAEKKAAAERFRSTRACCQTLVVHVLSSPGAGKTALLEALGKVYGPPGRMAVLVGDLATDRDAKRLERLVPVVQITTGGACHLEIPLVERAFGGLPPKQFDFLFIEDVGNLVCPASHDLGHHLRILVQSVTEGDDKAGKYPKAFRTAQALVISKTDLLPHVPFSVEQAVADAKRIQPDLAILRVCAPEGIGIPALCDYLEVERSRAIAAPPVKEAPAP